MRDHHYRDQEKEQAMIQIYAYLVQHYQNIYKIRINYAIQYTVHLGEIWT